MALILEDPQQSVLDVFRCWDYLRQVDLHIVREAQLFAPRCKFEANHLVVFFFILLFISYLNFFLSGRAVWKDTPDHSKGVLLAKNHQLASFQAHLDQVTVLAQFSD